MQLLLGVQQSWCAGQSLAAQVRRLSTWVSEGKLSKEFSALLLCCNDTDANVWPCFPNKDPPVSCEVNVRTMFQKSCNYFFMFPIIKWPFSSLHKASLYLVGLVALTCRGSKNMTVFL